MASGRSPSAPGRSLDAGQVRRGAALVVAFVALRALLWGPLWTQPSAAEPLRFGALVAASVLLGSVGLVYLGFTRWVGVDLRAWWVDRRRLRGDLGWGLVGAVLAALATAATVVGLRALGAPLPAPPVGSAPLPVGWLLLLVFGLAVASFQEETLFRGFLQPVVSERTGDRPTIAVQAVVFAVAHVGYYPLSAPGLYLVAFASGLVYGWLRHRRGRLLASGLAHGLLG